MKRTSRDNSIRYIYLEPFTFSAVNGNDSLIYNSLTGVTLEYRNSASVAGLISTLENATDGFLAEIDDTTADPDLKLLFSDLKESFSGDIISASPDKKPGIVRPRAVIKNYPPSKDFPSFTADDYLRNIYFFLNEDNDKICTDYRHAANQFFCPVYNSHGYNEISIDTVLKACLPFSGVSSLVLDLSGSDITRYSAFNPMLAGIKKLLLRINFHLPLPCYNPDLILKLLRVRNSRTSLYICFPGGLEALKEIRRDPVYLSNQKKVDLNFIIRSLDEYKLCAEMLQEKGAEKVFFIPYFTGRNAGFFKKNVYLAKPDILNLKPNQQQIFSRSVVNEQLYGKLFIRTDGRSYADLNQDILGNLHDSGISDLVRKEVYEGKSWNLTRMKVAPCSNCLYRLFCPPIGNYELFMKKFNFCDVI